MKKLAFTCKIRKRDALIASIEQQLVEQQQLAKKLNSLVLEQLTLAELKQVVKLNAKANKMLEETIKNPKDIIGSCKLGIKLLKSTF